MTLAKAGNWVLLEGVDASITRTATITDAEVCTSIDMQREAFLSMLLTDLACVLNLTVDFDLRGLPS